MYVSVAPFSEPGMLCLLARHLLSRTPAPPIASPQALLCLGILRWGIVARAPYLIIGLAPPSYVIRTTSPALSRCSLVRSLGQVEALSTHEELPLPLLTELPRVQSSRKPVCRRRNLYALGSGKSPIRTPLGMMSSTLLHVRPGVHLPNSRRHTPFERSASSSDERHWAKTFSTTLDTSSYTGEWRTRIVPSRAATTTETGVPPDGGANVSTLVGGSTPEPTA